MFFSCVDKKDTSKPIEFKNSKGSFPNGIDIDNSGYVFILTSNKNNSNITIFNNNNNFVNNNFYNLNYLDIFISNFFNADI